jgi:hypothetical protein
VCVCAFEKKINVFNKKPKNNGFCFKNFACGGLLASFGLAGACAPLARTL